MATILDKDIVRESTKEVDGRNIIVTLTKDQEISLKLKGMKSGAVKLPIMGLYGQLTGTVENEVKVKNTGVISIDTSVPTPNKGGKNNMMISLYDLRSQNAISGLDMPTLVKFEGIIKNLIDSKK